MVTHALEKMLSIGSKNIDIYKCEHCLMWTQLVPTGCTLCELRIINPLETSCGNPSPRDVPSEGYRFGPCKGFFERGSLGCLSTPI